MSNVISSRFPVTMTQMEGKMNIVNADCCKRYREKNAEEHKINDAFRKKRPSMLLKSNKDPHEEHKKRKEKENVWVNTERILQ